MKKIIYILLFIQNLGFAQKAVLDTNTIIIGDQIRFSISNAVKNTQHWPNYTDTIVNGLEIIKTGRIDTLKGIISQDFIISAWDSGSYYIPAFQFNENNKTKGLLLNVKTVILEEGAQLHDIKDPIDAPIGWSDIWPWLLTLLIAVLAIYLAKKYIFKNQKETMLIKPKKSIPADITALEQLAKLENNQFWQKGEIKTYHSELSEIIRRYTEQRFNFIALELTTDEILKALKDKINTEQLININLVLQRADLAKFAKSKPTADENKESMVLAKEFISATKKAVNNV